MNYKGHTISSWGGANIYPRLFVEMYEAATANRLDTVRDLQKKVLQLGAVYSHGLYYSAVIKGIKCALNILGLCSDFMAEPFHKFRAPERDDVRAELEKLGLM